MSQPLVLPGLRAKVVMFGTFRVGLVLKSGEIIGDVILAWGKEILPVGILEPPDLSVGDVVNVVDWSDDPPGR